MIGETITRLRAPTGDDNRYGGKTRDWAHAAHRKIRNVAIAPRVAAEDTVAGRQGVIIGLTIYMPPGTDLEPTDRAIVRGATYELDGEPGVWRHPYSGAVAGVEAALKRVEG